MNGPKTTFTCGPSKRNKLGLNSTLRRLAQGTKLKDLLCRALPQRFLLAMFSTFLSPWQISTSLSSFRIFSNGLHSDPVCIDVHRRGGYRRKRCKERKWLFGAKLMPHLFYFASSSFMNIQGLILSMIKENSIDCVEATCFELHHL